MKQINAYRCDFCGKIYLTPRGCKRHEKCGCCQRPELRPLCYSCQYYHQEMIETEAISYYPRGIRTSYDDMGMKKFDVNRCDHPDNERKLYNNFKLSAEVQEGLLDAGFNPMPNRKSGGCKFYAPIPGHPYADNTQQSVE